MGYKEFDIRISVQASEDEMIKIIRKKTGLSNFNTQIILKSLDARNKRNISWQYRLGITSDQIKSNEKPEEKKLEIPKSSKKEHVIIVGSGPSGIFSAILLAEAGMKVTVIERGSQVKKRRKDIEGFEQTGIFSEQNNYAFGEGGAGTFSDGKITSRTKGISLEKKYIFSLLLDAGAPSEIDYMTHPHLGSDNLINITENLRKKLENLEGKLLFDTHVQDFFVKNGSITKIITNKGILEGDYFIFGNGHSAYDTIKMLIKHGVEYQIKNFAIGMRAEHPRELINNSQWGVPELPGVKAAEYRLATKDSAGFPVYSFCMCPGGTIVPASAYKYANIVNGMSLYKRNNYWSNAAVVAGINPEEVLLNEKSPIAALDWLESLENSFFEVSNGYKAPAIQIKDFIQNKNSSCLPNSSYPFELISTDIYHLLPGRIIQSLQEGLVKFNRMLKGFDQGVLIGLESKTSSPVQVLRHDTKMFSTFNNLFVVGEGSGWAGGIISSAVDGLKASLALLKNTRK
jgi:uncharacterized FAD-dependent dehydrogenase